MKRLLKILAGLVVVAIVGALGFLSFSPTLRSDPNVGLPLETHAFGGVDVRQFTNAPLGAEVKVFLPIPPAEAVALASGFDRYPEWVAPPPEKVVVDNSARETGDFGAGSLVSYKEGETDEIVFFDPDVAMIAEPRWGHADFEGHRGVVIVTPAAPNIINPPIKAVAMPMQTQ